MKGIRNTFLSRWIGLALLLGEGAALEAQPVLSVSTFAGYPQVSGATNGTASAARFNFPSGLAIDATGNLYVTDMQSHTVRKVTPLAEVSTLAGLAGSRGSTDAAGAAARFLYPIDIVVGSGGRLYVADWWNDTIRGITTDAIVFTFAGRAGAYGCVDGAGTSAKFDLLEGLAADSAGNLYVADRGRVTSASRPSRLYGSHVAPGCLRGSTKIP